MRPCYHALHLAFSVNALNKTLGFTLSLNEYCFAIGRCDLAIHYSNACIHYITIRGNGVGDCYVLSVQTNL